MLNSIKHFKRLNESANSLFSMPGQKQKPAYTSATHSDNGILSAVSSYSSKAVF